MKFVDPNKLKIGDKIKYVSHKSRWNNECDNNENNNGLIIGKIYTVFQMKGISRNHMALPLANQNPIVKNTQGIDCGTAWWGSWVYTDTKIDLSHVKPYGIVAFLNSI